ncbi:MAG: GAF domain-containing sensor histidine kinase [Actinomycetota bacterium]
MKTNPQRQTAALVEAGMALSAEMDLDSLLQRIADLARDVVGAGYGAVGVVGEDGSLTRFVYSGIDDETAKAIGDLPTGVGVLGALIEETRPLRLQNITDHPRSAGFPPHHPPMKTFLGVPIMTRGRVFGRLYLTEKQGGLDFTKDDERIALTLASQAGIAVENAHLLDEIRERSEELAVLEERDRIAKELHDGVIQSIYSVGLSLQGSMSLVDRDSSGLRKRMDDAIGELDNVIRDVRSYIFALQPKSVEERGFRAALFELAKDLEVNTLAEVSVELDEAGLEAIHEDAQPDIIQIVREVLSNVARHSGASEASLNCSLGDGVVVIRIEDNGVGFDPNRVARGHGLNNIEERASRLGGRIQVLPREPTGTTLVVSIPAGEIEPWPSR